MATRYQNYYLIEASSYSYKCQASLFVRLNLFIQKYIFRHENSLDYQMCIENFVLHYVS